MAGILLTGVKNTCSTDVILYLSNLPSVEMAI